jgi:23S rRNA pseudouridine1911/1915/1917 synthase
MSSDGSSDDEPTVNTADQADRAARDVAPKAGGAVPAMSLPLVDELLPEVDEEGLIERAAAPPVTTGDTRGLFVPESATGQRLDIFLAQALDGYSREQIRRAAQAGLAEVDGRVVRPSFKLRAGQQIRFRVPVQDDPGPTPEPIPLKILYEDDGLIVIDKPAAMVVHPARGHWSGTLTSALAYHFHSLSDIGGPARPGIVHRLDRDTSGVIVVAKTNAVHLHLAEQFEQRLVEKEYWAIICGRPQKDRDWIEQPIAPHPYQREKMAIRSGHPDSKPAATFYEVQERFPGHSLLRLMPKTGRTHQIRVHLTHIGHPILCDRLYAGHSEVTAEQLRTGRQSAERTPPVLTRQALHARRLKLLNPRTGQMMEFVAPLPPDLADTLAVLQCRS